MEPSLLEYAEKWMALAIELSSHGDPAPNPHVGCVIVKNGRRVGSGYHDFTGGPHAERVAIAEAGDQATGADVFVTLEPCNHFGRTPPCSLGLIEAKVARVFIAVRDPNPKAAGGLDKLRSAGIQVFEGVLTSQAEETNHRFLFAQSYKRPFVLAKVACSLDGRIALPSGESKWITNEESRVAAHELRAQMGAVLVGRKTVELDNPNLTIRHRPIQNQPTRVILDPESKLENHFNVFNSEAPTIRYTRTPSNPTDRLLESNEPAWILNDLFSMGITGLMVEGGSVTTGNFVQANLVDQFEIFVGSMVLGEGPSWLTSHLGQRLSDLSQLRFITAKLLGNNLQISARPSRQ